MHSTGCFSHESRCQSSFLQHFDASWGGAGMLPQDGGAGLCLCLAPSSEPRQAAPPSAGMKPLKVIFPSFQPAETFGELCRFLWHSNLGGRAVPGDFWGCRSSFFHTHTLSRIRSRAAVCDNSRVVIKMFLRCSKFCLNSYKLAWVPLLLLLLLFDWIGD